MLLSSDSGDFSVLFFQRIIPTTIVHTTIVIIRMKTATIAPIKIGLLLFEGETAGVTNVDRDIEFVELPTSGD